MKPREIAAAVLNPVRYGTEFVEKRMDNALHENELSSQDRRLVQVLIYGVLRWQRTLDWLIERKTNGRPQKPYLQVLLRLGLYQLFWLDRIPDHAAVNETVEIAKQRGFGAQAGFINAVLRSYVREQKETASLLEGLKASQPDVGYSHPAWLFNRWEQAWGRAVAIQLMEWNNSPPPTYARLNALRATRDQITASWQEEGVVAHEAAFDWAGEDTVFELDSHPALNDLPSFRRGFFYIQDPSTLMAVKMLDAQPGETLLDACAAPGGKTAHLAQHLKNVGRLVAEDADPSRLALVEENSQRLGAQCVDYGAKSGEKFDRVLVDAPCSNTGVARRRVELRWRLTDEDIQRLSNEQEQILLRCSERVQPGGLLVYSTCSLEREENQEVVARFLARQPGFRLEGEKQLTPWGNGVDGAYVACLRCAPQRGSCGE